MNLLEVDSINCYMSIPKDTIVKEEFVKKIKGFIFAEEEARNYFLKTNINILNTIEKKVFLLNSSIDINNSYIINDKQVYYEYIIPELIRIGVKYIYLYNNFLGPSLEMEIYRLNIEGNNKVSCPVCNETSFDFIYNAFENPDDIKTFRILESYYAECINCGTIIKSPIEIKKDNFQEYGKNYYKQVSGSNESEDAIIHHVNNYQIPTYKTFKKFIDNSYNWIKYKDWLDVGSVGFPTTFKKYNFTTIEPSPQAVEIGKKLFNNSNIVCSVLDNYKASPNSYDGIIFHHSFYCLPDPNNAIEKCSELLRNNGVIIIAIGNFFMGTEGVFNDGKYLRLEEIFRGITLSTYYNPYSLEYLFLKNNFILKELVTLNHDSFSNSNYNSRYFVFERSTNHINDNKFLINKSKEYAQKLFIDTLNTWKYHTRNTLKLHNNRNTIFIGDINLFKDLYKIEPLNSIYGFVDFNNEYNNTFILNGIKHIAFYELFLLNEINIVICSFDKVDDILKKIPKVGIKEVYVPNRKSKIENLFFEYKDENFLTKAFVLKSID